jgi:hypothetical protein
MALIDALMDWERAWQSLGVDTEAELAPGISPEEVRAAIDFGPSHPDVETFLGWHNGSTSGFFSAFPTGRYFDPLEGILTTRLHAIAVMQHVLSWEEPEEYEEQRYPTHWLPILHNEDSGSISMDLKTGELWRYMIGPVGSMIRYPQRMLRIADSLEDLIPVLIDAIEPVRSSIRVEGFYIDYDPRLLPADLYDRGIVE